MHENTTMWAMTLTGPSRLTRIQTSALTADHLSDGEVLIRTLAGGICGSDLPFFQGRRAPGTVATRIGSPLHEIAGEVVATRDERFDIGDRVVGWATKQDGLAEYVISAGHSLHVFSAELDPAVAIMLQPLACVLYAVEQIGDVVGTTAAVLGLGPIGVLFAHVLKTRGAAKVIGVDRVNRSDIGVVFGVDDVVCADVSTWAADIEDADRPEVIVEAIGHQVESLTAAVVAAAYEARVFYFGIPNDDVYPLPMNRMLRKNMTLQAGVTALPHRRRVLALAEDYLRAHPELATHYLAAPYKFEDAEEAFRSAVRPRTGQMKVTLGI